MTRTLTASMRRMNRLMGPGALTRKTRSFSKAMTGLMVDSSLAALAPKAAKPRKATPAKTARKPGKAVKRLRAARALVPGLGSLDPSPRIPKGARYLERRHRSATGSRGYKLYLPASHPKRPKGLILMLHGCQQTPDDFAIGTHMNALAEKHGLAIAYPAQTRRNNPASCWNWFKPGNQLRGAGEPAMLAALARKLMREFGLHRDGVFVAGLSSGGAMAAILADVYPDVFSAAGIHSGLTRGAARDAMSAMSAMRSGGTPLVVLPVLAAKANPVRRIIFQGDTDRTVHASNAPMIVAAALGNDAEAAKITNWSVRGRGYARSDFTRPDGLVVLELWMLEGADHAWSGGRAAGSFTDAKGPDASAQMVRFFLSKSA